MTYDTVVLLAHPLYKGKVVYVMLRCIILVAIPFHETCRAEEWKGYCFIHIKLKAVWMADRQQRKPASKSHVIWNRDVFSLTYGCT